MFQGGVAEGRGEGRRDGDEEEVLCDCGGGEDGGGSSWFVGVCCCEGEVDGGDEGGEDGLDGVEEDGVGPSLWCGGGAVGGGCYAFLEDRPCETVRCYVREPLIYTKGAALGVSSYKRP